jgi:hypothetical protein
MKITYAYIEENLFKLGTNGDGHDVDGLRYSIVVKTAYGRRFAHNFDVAQTGEWNEDRLTPVDWDEAEMEKLEALKDRINKTGAINPDNGHWVEIEPQYGTEAWLDYAVTAA